VKWARSSCGYYSDSGCGYRISVATIGALRVYTAWAPCESSNPYARQGWEALGYYRDGSEGGKVKAAVAACESHYKKSLTDMARIAQ